MRGDDRRVRIASGLWALWTAAALYDWACSLDPQTRGWREWQVSVFLYAPPGHDYERRNGETAALLTALVAARGCE